MTERMLKNRIEKLDAIAAQQKALEEQAEKIRNEIKADMEEKEVDEISAFGRIARWKEVISSRLSFSIRSSRAAMSSFRCWARVAHEGVPGALVSS
nr:hypothetical protein [uncultured Acetatifactor sp.]